jgi:O-methyltransferase involved in polyketide biosynthesis
VEPIRFTEEKATMLATLYARALDARAELPVLGDPSATATIDRIDYDWKKTGVTTDHAVVVAARAKLFDTWARRFIDRHPNSLVVHLGCGLDARVGGVDPPETVTWYDVEYPEAIAVRERIYSGRANYHLLGTSVADRGWIEHLPDDRPTMVVGEGLVMYLDPMSGPALLGALLQRLSGGEVAFDFISRFGVLLQKASLALRKAGATARWRMDDPRDLAVLGLSPAEVVPLSDILTDDTVQKCRERHVGSTPSHDSARSATSERLPVSPSNYAVSRRWVREAGRVVCWSRTVCCRHLHLCSACS